MKAAFNGRTETVKALIELGADIYYEKDLEGKTINDYVHDKETKREIIDAYEKYKREHVQGLKKVAKSSSKASGIKNKKAKELHERGNSS